MLTYKELKSKIEVSQRNREMLVLAITFNEYQTIKPNLIKDNVNFDACVGDIVILKVLNTTIDYDKPLIKKLLN